MEGLKMLDVHDHMKINPNLSRSGAYYQWKQAREYHELDRRNVLTLEEYAEFFELSETIILQKLESRPNSPNIPL